MGLRATALLTAGIWMAAGLASIARAQPDGAPAATNSEAPHAPEAPHSPPAAHVAYLGTTAVGVDSDVVAAFEAGVEKALAATSIIVVHLPRDDRPRGADGQPCVTSTCLGALAARAGATHVVHGRLGLDPIQGQLAYSGSLEMVRIAPYQIVTAVPVACDRCIAKMLKAAAEVETSALMGQFFDAERRQWAAASEAQAAEKPGEKPANKGLLEEPKVAPTPTTVRPVWPLILGGAGVALLATGIVFVAEGEKSQCPERSASECKSVQDFRPWGIALGVAGAAATLVGGLIYFRWPSSDGSSAEAGARVGFGPSGLSVRGTF